jgi:hypothetical protein
VSGPHSSNTPAAAHEASLVAPIISSGVSTGVDGDVSTPTAQNCLNCDAPLTGEYCASCGQHSKHHVHSTSALFSELIEDLFHTDHRMWRTLRPLLLKPGKLTAEYLRGKRVTYTPPFRLYIVLSLIFFLSTSLTHDEVDIVTADEAISKAAQSEPTQQAKTYDIDEDVADKLDEFLERVEREKRPKVREQIEKGLRKIPPAEQKQVVAGMVNPCSPSALGSAIPETIAGRKQLLETCRKVTKNNGKDVVEGIRHHAPQAMFFLLPLLALVTKVLYVGSRRYYAEHVLFFVHFHSFAFLLLAFDNVSTWLLGKIPHTSFAAGLITAAVYLYLPLYLFRSMRTVFGGGRFVTGVRLSFLLWGYVGMAFLTFMVVAAYTAMTLE